MYGKSQKERMDNLDQANQETDRLRKQLAKLQVELQEATQEAEVSKRRRDWAFSERDKVYCHRVTTQLQFTNISYQLQFFI